MYQYVLQLIVKNDLGFLPPQSSRGLQGVRPRGFEPALCEPRRLLPRLPRHRERVVILKVESTMVTMVTAVLPEYLDCVGPSGYVTICQRNKLKY